MNREIKFRGRTPEGKWIYGDLLRVAGGTLIYYGSPVEAETCELEGVGVALMSNEISVVVPETVGQFTGLYDADGEGIYEEDIIKSGDNNIHHVISYNENLGAFVATMINRYMYNTDGMKTECNAEQRWIAEWRKTVVGNIYDNPELLKGGTE